VLCSARQFCSRQRDAEFLLCVYVDDLLPLFQILSTTHGFRDNEVLLQPGYDAIVISLSGGAARNFLIAESERATQILY